MWQATAVAVLYEQWLLQSIFAVFKIKHDKHVVEMVTVMYYNERKMKLTIWRTVQCKGGILMRLLKRIKSS